MLNLNEIKSGLEGVPSTIKIHGEVTSTNDLLRQWENDGAPEWSVVISDKQTAGKGRIGRNFFSPGGCGIYMSVLLKPLCPISECLQITGMTAVAVVKSMEAVLGSPLLEASHTHPTGIKWVNDIYFNGLKVCGILTEGIPGENRNTLRSSIIGIGINTYLPNEDFPEELNGIVGTLLPQKNTETGNDIRNSIISGTLNNMYHMYPGLQKRTFLKEYRALSFLTKQSVGILSPEGTIAEKATVLQVEDDMKLTVKTENGEIRHLDSGEVKIIPV